MAEPSYLSWGGWPRAVPAKVRRPSFRQGDLCLDSDVKWLPRGNGRSYGDGCLNDRGGLIDTRRLDRFISFDPATGILSAEAGILLAEIIDLVVPRGWFLPVTPGTKFITLGGAIANDVHGKNHHSSGSFGNWVSGFELRRSDGTVMQCSPERNPEHFRASIGGMGLTGLILSATIQLQAINTPALVCETIPFASLDELMAIDAMNREEQPNTVAWFDCMSATMRGAYMTGSFASGPEHHTPPHRRRRQWNVPLTPPSSLLSGAGLRLFNTLYYYAQRAKRNPAMLGLDDFFYPLDALANWNRLYGPKGFVQLQFVVPFANAQAVITEVLARLRQNGLGSFLAVAKSFGSRRPVGLMSFPMEGMTLALDLPRTSALPDALRHADNIVREAGGRFYAAKDAYSSPKTFQAGYPNLEQFIRYVDPAFSSDLWRRLTAREHT